VEAARHTTAAPDSVTSVDLLREAMRVNDETERGVERSERIVAATEDVGGEVYEVLARQGEAVDEINRDLDSFPAILKRAKKDLVVVARRLMRDRCFLVCFIVALGLSVMAIVVTVVKAKARL
jgi:t-SNARE complex subunit (syntaxin)